MSDIMGGRKVGFAEAKERAKLHLAKKHYLGSTKALHEGEAHRRAQGSVRRRAKPITEREAKARLSALHARARGVLHMKAVGSYREVWHGTAHHTAGGLKKHNLMRLRAGTRVNSEGRTVAVFRIVSRAKHEQGLKAYRVNNELKVWNNAVRSARAALKLGAGVFPKKTGGGDREKLYRHARKLYRLAAMA